SLCHSVDDDVVQPTVAIIVVYLQHTSTIVTSLFPNTTLFRSCLLLDDGRELRYTDARRFGRIAYLTEVPLEQELTRFGADPLEIDRKSTRLNSSHQIISYSVFCL